MKYYPYWKLSEEDGSGADQPMDPAENNENIEILQDQSEEISGENEEEETASEAVLDETITEALNQIQIQQHAQSLLLGAVLLFVVLRAIFSGASR